MNVAMKMRSSAFVSAILFMSIGVSAVAQAASAGGSCKKAGRTVVASGVNLRCTQTKTGLKWRVVAPPAKSSEPSATTTPVVAAPIVPFVSVEPTLLRQPGVISVNSNVVGTVYIAEVSVKVSKVSDIENAGRYLWVSAPITKVGVNEISVDIDAIINGNYRVYVANDKGVLSAASLNMVVVSMARIYDRVAAQSWSRQFGTSAYDDVWSIAVDTAGNVYTAGSTGGDLYGFNAGVEFDIFVNKFDLLGNLIASVQFGTAFDDSQPYISVDTSGNVFIAGWTQGAFAGNTRLGGGDGFVAKFNSSLVLQGTVKQFGTTINERVYSLAVDGLGNVYVGGQTSGAFTGNTNLGEYDGFVAKFNSSLVLQGTVKQFGTTGIDGVGALAADGSGSVYVAGNSAGAFSGYTNLGSRDAFVAKFNSSLDLQGTVKQFGTAGEDQVWAVVVDGSGSVYLAGPTAGAFSGYTNLGDFDGFVAKFNSSLDLQGTVKQFGTAGEDQVWGVVVDGSGSVYVAGPTDGAFTGFTNLGDYDGFAAKFNSSLDLQGTVKQFGTTGADLTYSIAVDDASNVYIAGSTAGAFTGNTRLGLLDGFVAKFNSSLDLQGTVQQFGTSENDVAYSVAVDSTRNVYVAGSSLGDLFGDNAGDSDAFIYKEVA